jgi:WD40 repeat protein
VVFFGRDTQVDQLLVRLGRQRFLAVVGTSGCGKSSLVHAGLIPALGAGLLGSAGARWAVGTMRPGDRPFWRLAQALLDPTVLGPAWSDLEHPAAQLHAMLQRGPLGLVEVLAESPLSGGRKLLLLVDQFEELFRYRREGEGQRDEANAFVSLLLVSARAPEATIYVVLTMRSDYLGDCALFDGLPEALNDSQFLTPKLTRAQRQQAIEGPARVFEGRAEPKLVARILNDMDSGPDQLPLMQHALMRLWKGSHGTGSLTLAAYEAVGGLEGALSGQANAAYASLGADEQRITEVMFRRLSTRTAAGRYIRLPTSLEEVSGVAEVSPQAVLAVVDVFRNPDCCFLTPPWPQEIGPEDILDISHESLILHWDRLRAWVAYEAASAEIYRRLDQTARLWSEGKAGMWGFPDLDQALRWKEEARPNQVWATRYEGDFDRAIRFLDASVGERDRKEAEQRESSEFQIVQKSRAEAVRLRAEAAEARQRIVEAGARRLRIATAVSILLAVAAGWQTWSVYRERDLARRNEALAEQNAEKARDSAKEARNNEALAKKNENWAMEQLSIAKSRQLAAASATERDKNLDLSLIVAVEALRTHNTLEARTSLFKALRARPGLRSFLHINEGEVRSVTFSPDGKTVAVGFGGSASRGGVLLWDSARCRRLADVSLEVKEGRVSSVAFSPDGKTVAAGYDAAGVLGAGGVMLWNAARGEQLVEAPLQVKEGGVRGVAFSPDGKAIAAGYGGHGAGGLVLWNAASLKRLVGAPLDVPKADVSSLAFSPDGKTIAAGYGGRDGNGVVLWDAASLKRLVGAPLDVPEGNVSSLAFSPDGKAIAAGYKGSFSAVGGVVLWDAAGRKRLVDAPLDVEEGWVESIAFSPDAIAAGYRGVRGGGVVRWDAASRKRLDDAPLDVREGSVISVAFSPDGKTVAAGYRGLLSDVGGVVLWDAAGHQRLVDASLRVKEGDVVCVAFSPDSKTIGAGYSGGVILWDTAGRGRPADVLLPVKEGEVYSMAFSSDGKTIAAGYGFGATGIPGGVVLWNAAARKLLVDAPLVVKEGRVYSVAFSPDGTTIAAGFGGLDSGGGVVLWDADGRKRLLDAPLNVEEGDVSSVAFSPDGKTIAASYGFGSVPDNPGGVVLWRAAGQKWLVDDRLDVKEGNVSSVAFSPEGETVAASYGAPGGGGVVLWRAAGRKWQFEVRLDVKEGNVSSVAFSPDGKTIAAGYGGRDGNGVVLWVAPDRRRLVDAPLDVEGGEVKSVAFSPDGKSILAAGYSVGLGRGGGVVLRDVNLESWKHIAAQIANRNLTRAEWGQYLPDQPYRATFPDLPVPEETTRD